MVKKVIIPIAETAILDTITEDSVKTLGLKIKDEYGYLVTILSGEDPQLQIRTLYLIGHLKDKHYLPFVLGLINSPDEQVRETAKFAIQNIWGYPC